MAVAAGDYHSFAMRADGTIVAWGRNAEGQLDVPAGPFEKLASGHKHGLAIRSNGILETWGRNDSGELDFPAGYLFLAVAGGDHQSAAVAVAFEVSVPEPGTGALLLSGCLMCYLVCRFASSCSKHR